MTHEKNQLHNTNNTGSPGTLSARDHQAEEALRISEARYRALVEFQPDLLCRFLPDSTLTFVNDPYCEYFGMAREELLGRSFLVFIPENERAASAARIRSLNLAKPVGSSEHRVLAANGEIRWHQWINKAIFDYRGEIVEFQATGRDITEKK